MPFTAWKHEARNRCRKKYLQQGLEIRGFWFQKKTVQLKTLLREVYTYVLYEIFFSKNRVSSRHLFKIRATWGYTYVLKGILIDFFLAYLAIGTFFNWDLLSWFNLIKVACIASGWFRPPVFIIKTKFVLFRACWK